MAGLILVALGVFRLGTVVKFIPYPIVVGFTAGIALTIFSTQINDFLGLGLKQVPSEFLPKLGCISITGCKVLLFMFFVVGSGFL